MKKLVLFFVLLFAIQLFAAPADSTKYQHDPKPAFWLWKDIRGYFLYSDTTLYHKRFQNAQFTGDLRLQNNERIKNTTDATIEFQGNDDAATLMTVIWSSSNDNGNIADNDKIRHVLIKSWDEDSTANNSWVIVDAQITDATGNSKDSKIAFLTYDANSQVTPLYLAGNDAVFADDVEINGTVTLENDETIDNATDGTVQITANNLKLAYDAAAYLLITQADGGGVTLNCTSDGTASFTISDATTFSSTIASAAHGATLVTDAQVGEINYTGIVHQTVFTFTADTINIMDHAAAGAHGKKLIMTFPAGIIKIIGATSDIAVSCGTSGLTATATYDYALGSTAVGIDNSTLATTEQDIMTLVEGDLSSSAADWNGYDVTDLGLDGHTTPATCYINIAFEQDDASANDVATITGVIKITWVDLGDY